MLVANFASGSVAVLPVAEDGSLKDASCVIQHEGSSVDPKRQAGPHAHAVELSADNRYAFVPELGADKVMIYALDAKAGKLTPNNNQPFVNVAPGAGPRQLVMHPNGKLAFLINELNSTMTSYAYDAAKGTLTEIQTLSTLPKDFAGHSTCAEVQIHPTGKFLYGSNRGHDSIVIYAIDQATGRLTLVGHESDTREDSAQFRREPGRRLPGRGKPGFRQRRDVPHRPGERQAHADRKRRRGGDANLRSLHVVVAYRLVPQRFPAPRAGPARRRNRSVSSRHAAFRTSRVSNSFPY